MTARRVGGVVGIPLRGNALRIESQKVEFRACASSDARWLLMTRQLRGKPAPALPTLPGRVVQARVPVGDAIADAWDLREQRMRSGWYAPRP